MQSFSSVDTSSHVQIVSETDIVPSLQEASNIPMIIIKKISKYFSIQGLKSQPVIIKGRLKQ
jgi:hypothetical protein